MMGGFSVPTSVWDTVGAEQIGVVNFTTMTIACDGTFTAQPETASEAVTLARMREIVNEVEEALSIRDDGSMPLIMRSDVEDVVELDREFWKLEIAMEEMGASLSHDSGSCVRLMGVWSETIDELAREFGIGAAT